MLPSMCNYHQTKIKNATLRGPTEQELKAAKEWCLNDPILWKKINALMHAKTEVVWERRMGGMTNG